MERQLESSRHGPYFVFRTNDSGLAYLDQWLGALQRAAGKRPEARSSGQSPSRGDSYLRQHADPTPQSVLSLLTVERLEPVSAATLQQESGLAGTTARRHLRRFERDGLLKRSRRKGGRPTLRRLTPKGHGVLEGWMWRARELDLLDSEDPQNRPSSDREAERQANPWTLWSVGKARVLVALGGDERNRDGWTAGEVAEQVGGDPGRRIFRTLDGLAAEGFLECSWEGRSKYHHPDQQVVRQAIGSLIDAIGRTYYPGSRETSRRELLRSIRGSLRKTEGAGADDRQLPGAHRTLITDLRLPSLLTLIGIARGDETVASLVARSGENHRFAVRSRLRLLERRGLVRRRPASAGDRHEPTEQTRPALQVLLTAWLDALDKAPDAVLDGSRSGGLSQTASPE